MTPGTATPADIDTGVPPVLRSASLGNLTSAPVFHSIATLNPGDANQVLSGASRGGLELLMGFEDLPSATGDNDFQDVIFSVRTDDLLVVIACIRLDEWRDIAADVVDAPDCGRLPARAAGRLVDDGV